MKACQKKRFADKWDVLVYFQRAMPQYRWRYYFCQTCISWHGNRKRNHQQNGKPGRIQVLQPALGRTSSVKVPSALLEAQ